MNEHEMLMERSLLGCLLHKPVLIDSIASKVRIEDFMVPAHAKMFREMVLMHEAGKPYHDLNLLVIALREKKIMGDRIDQLSLEDLGKMGDVVQNVNHAPYYAEEIIKYAQLRAQKSLVTRAGLMLDQMGTNPKEVAALLINETEKINARITIQAKSIGECGFDAIESFKQRRKVGKSMSYPTSLPSVDVYIGGVAAKELTIIAARPSNGKTSWLMQMLEYNAMRGSPSLFFSLEMHGSEVAQRKLCALANVSSQRWRQGNVCDEEIEFMESQAKMLKNLPITIVDGASETGLVAEKITTRKIRAEAKLLKEQNGLDIVAIDYLSMIHSTDSRLERPMQIGNIVKELKQMAKDLNVAVVLLSQLNRKAGDERPAAHHLRESGNVEEDADVIMLLHNPPIKKSGQDAEIIIPKCRNSSPGSVVVGWDGNKTKFYDLTD